MSPDESTLLFEGFLKKRKDTMKMRWATYWFRLQNTTLFFYTKKDGSASHLRGLYYIYTVQAVREVQRDTGKRFVFEIIMTNGKRKVLAAETAALRREWMGHLWQAMHLSSSGALDHGNTHLDVCEQRESLQCSTNSCSDNDSVSGSLPARPLSAPALPDQPRPEDRRTLSAPALPDQPRPEDRTALSSFCFTEQLDGEEPTYLNTLPACKRQHEHHNDERLSGATWYSEFSSEKEQQQEGDYDVLPPRNTIYEVSQPERDLDQTENPYDVPVFNRRAADRQERRQVQTESIYDVPSSLLRKMSDHTVDDQLEDGATHEEDMTLHLGRQPTDCGGNVADSEELYTPVHF
ncbi:uncharacterized protein LOC115363117 [Myripristis murdjan]|uniref:uncharacterized protein LOC115363117 n=1 Tax=Myripristis murdjan TaxID=586833 RepID=UPI0011762A50|nr:uncharacterized protein LOC115363117 [Myripristis murdjan]